MCYTIHRQPQRPNKAGLNVRSGRFVRIRIRTCICRYVWDRPQKVFPILTKFGIGRDR